MRKLLIIITTIFLSGCFHTIEEKTIVIPNNISTKQQDEINQIKQKVEYINTKHSITETNETPNEGTETQKFYTGEIVEKAIKTIYRETGKMVQEFYFEQRKPLFIIEKKYTYNRPVSRSPQVAKENDDSEYFDIEKSIIEEYRYFYKDEKVIRYIGPDLKLQYYPSDPDIRRNLDGIHATLQRIKNSSKDE